MQRHLRSALLATLLVFSGVAAATPPATGLGQAYPNAQDQSTSPNFHAFVFVIGGIQYIQINDTNGNVLGAVGSAGGQYIVLPVGLFAQQVSTPQQAPAATTATPTAAPTQIYNDGQTQMTATPMSDGTTQLNVVHVSSCTDPTICGSGGA